MMPVLPLNFIFSYPISIQIAYFLSSLVIAAAGWNRKMGFWGYLFSSVIFSPLIGLMLLLVSDKKHSDR